MKTAEEKAIEVCEKLGLPSNGPAFAAIRIALKEQDRDTRHACAGAVISCKSNYLHEDAIWKEDAHDACMNVQSV